MSCSATRLVTLIWLRSISPGRMPTHPRISATKSYMLALERSNLTRFYLDNYLNAYTADARVIAFSTQKEESRFLKNPSEETYGITMLTQTVPVNASKDSSIYRSVLMKTPKVLGGSYDAETNSMSGAEPLTLEYQFGTDIDVESLTFENVSEEFAGTGSSLSHILPEAFISITTRPATLTRWIWMERR